MFYDSENALLSVCLEMFPLTVEQWKGQTITWVFMKIFFFKVGVIKATSGHSTFVCTNCGDCCIGSMWHIGEGGGGRMGGWGWGEERERERKRGDDDLC